MTLKLRATCFPYTASFNLILKPALWEGFYTHFRDNKTKAERAYVKTQNHQASVWTRAPRLWSNHTNASAHRRPLSLPATTRPAILPPRHPAKRRTAGAEKEPQYLPRRPAVESSQHINHTHQHSKGFMLCWDLQGGPGVVNHPLCVASRENNQEGHSQWCALVLADTV